jgi:serine/threonine protein kinase
MQVVGSMNLIFFPWKGSNYWNCSHVCKFKKTKLKAGRRHRLQEIRLTQLREEWVQKCLKQEMKITLKLKHRNVIKAYDVVKTRTSIVSAVTYIDNKGIAHRDMKLENFSLNRTTALLSDFGFSRCVADENTNKLIKATTRSFAFRTKS